MRPRHSKCIAGYALVLLGLFLLSTPSPLEAGSARQSFEEGLKAFERGAFEEAASRWAEAARTYERDGNPAEQASSLTHLAQANLSLGQYKQALSGLEAALKIAQRLNDPARIASTMAALGNALIPAGPPEVAEKLLERSLGMAKKAGDSVLAAVILNNRGNLLAKQEKYAEAVAAYRESGRLAQGANRRELAARALSNAGVALRHGGAPQESRGSLDAASDLLRQAPPSHETAFTWIQIGWAYRDLRSAMPDPDDRLLLQASTAFREAGTLAERLADQRAASYAWGSLGAVYEDGRRYPEALQLTRKAIFAAQQVNAPESLYRWEWQTGRLLHTLGNTDEAISAYRRAVHTLQSTRRELSSSYGGPQASFRESVGRVYFELVDLLLQRASLQNPDQATPYLIEAREAVELFKVNELRDYFRDDCVETALSKVSKLDVVSRTAVVVYPILLPDRTELLASLPTGLKRISVPVGSDALTHVIREFRLKLEKRTTREYLPYAQQLYRWLIEPLEPDLTVLKADTLIFVPDGPLRTIPMAALHDGKRFLVEKYALGITPGLDLTDPRPINREHMKVLAVGVTEPVQGFSALPDVSAELDALRTLFGSTTLLNQEFRVSAFEKELKDETFTIVHIASHGHFGSDVKQTFLLAFDDKLTMDRLDQLVGVFKFRDEPLDLLTLSACDTAAGDDLAALGLAGVAIKAGARSALATLWDINDRVTSDLVADFYRELKDPAISRAAALQRAQVKVLRDPRYEHPGFWSAFLMINNWL